MPGLMSQLNDDVRVFYFQETRILDEATIQQIGRELLAMAAKAESGKLLLNLEEVKFMSSAMLGKLIELNKRCKAEEIDLKLCSISPEIMEIFKMTRLNKVLDIHKNEGKALSSFRKRGLFS